jgi:predicted DNA-binding transcriptional regulator AlpA
MDPTLHRKPINASEAAEYLGISASTLSKRRVFGGGPKYLKLGRKVVYDPRDLDAWLDAHRRTSTSDGGEVAGITEHRARQAGSAAPADTPGHKLPRRRGEHVAVQVGRCG